jgi:hypothetical protein
LDDGDGDGDGFFNGSEFEAGSGAGDGTSVPPGSAVREVENRGDSFYLSIDPPGYSGARPALFFSPDLSAGSWLDIGDFTKSGEVWQFSDEDGVRRSRDRGYYRSALRPDVTP